MLHCFKQGYSAKDTGDKICTIYGNSTMTIMTVRNWYKKFRAGNLELKDEDLSGCLVTNTDRIKTLIAENPQTVCPR